MNTLKMLFKLFLPGKTSNQQNCTVKNREKIEENCLASGTSGKPFMDAMAGVFWEECAEQELMPECFRVGSAENPADLPTRPEKLALLRQACPELEEIELTEEEVSWIRGLLALSGPFARFLRAFGGEAPGESEEESEAEAV